MPAFVRMAKPSAREGVLALALGITANAVEAEAGVVLAGPGPVFHAGAVFDSPCEDENAAGVQPAGHAGERPFERVAVEILRRRHEHFRVLEHADAKRDVERPRWLYVAELLTTPLQFFKSFKRAEAPSKRLCVPSIR